MIPDDAEPRVEQGKLPRDDTGEVRIAVVVVTAINTFVEAATSQGSRKNVLAGTRTSAADNALAIILSLPLASTTSRLPAVDVCLLLAGPSRPSGYVLITAPATSVSIARNRWN
jgi:hypothetical protein